MAFFLESTFVGLFFFGWDRLSKVQHMCVTAGGSGVQPLRVVDSGSERLDAKPNRCGFQFRNHAYGNGELL